MKQVNWNLYPFLLNYPKAKEWLQIQLNLGGCFNTVDAYGRGLNCYFEFCNSKQILIEEASFRDVTEFIHYLRQRPVNQGKGVTKVGLAPKTIYQRLTVVRLFYNYLIEVGVCVRNPASRNTHTTRRGSHQYGGAGSKSLIACPEKSPWIPNDSQWIKILQCVREESLRNRLMLAFAYDGALRREEVCGIEIRDISPGERLITIRSEVSKSYQDRIVFYSEDTGYLFSQYLKQRCLFSAAPGPLFLSESRRNQGKPLTIWTWSKVIEGIRDRTNLPELTTHTFRHLRLTDLARDGWSLHAIAKFAGHQNVETTQLYIHLSGREIAEAAQRGMNKIHDWRSKTMKELLL